MERHGRNENMANELTRNNHYVPEWYQRGFLAPGQSQYAYLDTTPELLQLPGGITKHRRSLFKWGPVSCFVQRDLYTTFLGQHPTTKSNACCSGTLMTVAP